MIQAAPGATVNLGLSDESIKLIRQGMESVEKKHQSALTNWFPGGYLIFTAVKGEQIVPLDRKSDQNIFNTDCHAERTNLSVRTFTRRFTRCTIGYSKKLDNLRYAVAMFICHFNFCRKHSAHGKTPAQASGLTEKTWTIDEILSATI